MSRHTVLATLAATAALTLALSASAETVTSLNGGSSWGYVPGDDVKSGGSASVVSTPSNDGDGSLKITTDSSVAGDSNAKAYAGTGRNLGLLTQLTSLSFEYKRDTSSTTPANGSPAFKLFLNNGTQSASLTWEYAYNAAGAAPAGSWQTVDLTSQNFWLRFAGNNYDIAAQVKNLNTWSTYSGTDDHGFNFANATITGIQIGYGSGIAGQFTAYADNVELTSRSSGGISYAADFADPSAGAGAAVPTPAALGGGALLLAGLAFARRRTASI